MKIPVAILIAIIAGILMVANFLYSFLRED